MDTYVGYVTGWRWFLIDTTSKYPSPCSIGMPFRWRWAGEHVAASPLLHNRLGYYAYKDDAVEHLKSGTATMPLIGKVALYGDVIEHAHGHRGEKARILDTWCSVELWKKLQHIPQVVGIYVIDKHGDESCLTLENLKKSRNIFPSDSQTMLLRSR